MKNNFIIEALISIVLIGLLIFFLNPMELHMPQSVHMIMLPLLGVFFVVLIGVLWREKPGDERENLHIFLASRFGYFAAILTLIIAVIYQSFQKTIDPWLIIALCVVLLAKLLGLVYGYWKH